MPLIDLLNRLPQTIRGHAIHWIEDGAPDAPYENESGIVTAKLRSFRLAYKNASDDQIEEFLNQI